MSQWVPGHVMSCKGSMVLGVHCARANSGEGWARGLGPIEVALAGWIECLDHTPIHTI